MITLKKTRIIIFIVLALIPLMAYYFIIMRVPSISVEKAYESLIKNDKQCILIDTRSEFQYNKEHIYGALNWTYHDIKKLKSLNQMPEQCKHASLFFLSGNGIRGACAVKQLIHLGHKDVYNVEGGMTLWIGGVNRSDTEINTYAAFIAQDGKIYPFPSKKTSFFEQVLIFVSAFVIKPFYMFLALLIVIFIWKEKSRDILILKWSLVGFLIGENFCVVNFVLYKDTSVIIEYIHIYGMIVSFSLFFYSLMIAIEDRIVHFQNPQKKCVLFPVCVECYKNKDITCRIKILFSVMTIFLIAISCMPLLFKNYSVSYNAVVFGNNVHYMQPVLIQYFESKISPIISIFLFIVAFITSRFKDNRFFSISELFFSFGLGYLTFGFFRIILFAFYEKSLWWYAFWEEFTELLFITGIALVLMLFRKNFKFTFQGKYLKVL